MIHQKPDKLRSAKLMGAFFDESAPVGNTNTSLDERGLFVAGVDGSPPQVLEYEACKDGNFHSGVRSPDWRSIAQM
jgi:hypothetical protein